MVGQPLAVAVTGRVVVCIAVEEQEQVSRVVVRMHAGFLAVRTDQAAVYIFSAYAPEQAVRLVRLERGLQRPRHGRLEHERAGRCANQAVHNFYFFYKTQERQRNVRRPALGMLAEPSH